jgi:hypothetical protein
MFVEDEVTSSSRAGFASMIWIFRFCSASVGGDFANVHAFRTRCGERQIYACWIKFCSGYMGSLFVQLL